MHKVTGTVLSGWGVGTSGPPVFLECASYARRQSEDKERQSINTQSVLMERNKVGGNTYVSVFTRSTDASVTGGRT